MNSQENANQREYFVKGRRVALARCTSADSRLNYENWLDSEVQRNFNTVPPWSTFEEYTAFWNSSERPPRRFVATIVCLPGGGPIGIMSLSPEGREPDLSICLYRGLRGQGLGTEAFRLAAAYVFGSLGLDFIVAGAYEHNEASVRMLTKAGFSRDHNRDVFEDNQFGDGQVRQLAFRLEKSEWEALDGSGD